ncbi:MAG: trypsin-like peptidase domain-containing protein [Ilumatobacteraceae bacterium]
MGASKTPRSSAAGRVSARPARVVIAAAWLAVSSTAVPEWSSATALAPRTSTTATVAAATTAADDALREAEPLTTVQAEPREWAEFSGPGVNAYLTLARPHVLAGDVADVIVHVRGGRSCTGTPITGTTYVVTAAHCVLDADGEVSRRTVVRDGVEYTAAKVLVNPKYHDSPGPLLDAAVLIMDHAIEGPSATLGNVFPARGLVTVAGFQALDSDGSLLRGTRYDNRPLPQGATGGVVQIDSAAAGCVHLVSDMEVTSTGVKVPCGLIPGASGGGLFVESNGELILVGIISTVAVDLSFNGVVPLSALHELLENPVGYTHEMPVRGPTRATVRFS